MFVCLHWFCLLTEFSRLVSVIYFNNTFFGHSLIRLSITNHRTLFLGTTVTHWSIIAANLGNEQGSCLQLFPPRNPEGVGQMESTGPGWVCQHRCWTNVDKLIIREANDSRDEGLEKRKEKIYFGCWHPGEVTGSSLNKWPLHLQDEHLEIHREMLGRRVYSREQAESTWSYVGVHMCSGHGMVREGDMWGVVF